MYMYIYTYEYIYVYVYAYVYIHVYIKGNKLTLSLPNPLKWRSLLSKSRLHLLPNACVFFWKFCTKQLKNI